MSLSSSAAYRCFLAVFGKTREWVLALNFVALVYYHNAPVVFVSLGACLCGVVAKLLKLVIRQERPARKHGRRQSYGMPSSHSAGMGYYATLIPMLLADCGGGLACTLAATLLLGALGAGGALYRAASGHHTLAQVAAGVVVGWAVARAWWLCRGPVLQSIESVLHG
ncbi:hypothetical protein H4R18_001455 [Coemansia javaensis]|uniref:Phosphatidic acid phosphatase type 2/haloperoxidase domain-containing protein n=1 Tax=Coemansia javaensis TaxID=2761396 RepID=A0A9W8LK94_9FUNG|nr:hypothetical protein H4R18_001455 [Coemansia javaensis]